MAHVELKTFGDLLDARYKFILPDYQRGYRWRAGDNVEDSQVLQLLEDLLDYKKDKAYDGKFYCMQPMVVLEKDKSKNEYYLIDGQQRITTLYLFYRCIKYKKIFPVEEMKKMLPAEFIHQQTEQLDKSMFSLSYENRSENLTKFLKGIHEYSTDSVSYDSIDEDYLWNAYCCMDKWYREKCQDGMNKTFVEGLCSLLEERMQAVEQESPPKTIQFIWYELNAEESKDQKKLFSCINNGKIPLTSAELIKAYLFGRFDKEIAAAVLCKDNNTEISLEKAKTRFSHEWEEYENAMQDEAFWSFISKNEYDTRLEYLFELFLSDKNTGVLNLCTGQNTETPQHTFCIFKQFFETNPKYKNMECARQDFFEYFQKLRKFHGDWILHHLIGCLIHMDTSMPDIFLKLKNASSTHESSEILRRMIREKMEIYNRNIPITDMDQLQGFLIKLNYDSAPKNQLRNIFLVINIASILQMKQESVFFPFDKYGREKWDIEHICSQNEQIDENKQDVWLKTIIDYFAGTCLIDPPKGTESKEETKKRNEENKESLEHLDVKLDSGIQARFDLLRGMNPESTDFVERFRGERQETLKEFFLYGALRIILHGETKKALFPIILALVNCYERNGEPKPNPSHGLKNITLLDQKTNRTYHDSPFFVKRKFILSAEHNGRFILPCTRDVFMKAYSKALDKMF